MKDLIESMQEEIKAKIQYLNNGGCAKFAYFLSRNLTKLNIPYQITLCDDNEECIDEGFMGNYEVMHVLVYLPGIRHVDGYSTRTKSELLEKYEEIRTDFYYLSDLEYYAFDGIWNTLYDTDQNELLESIINKYINEEKITRVNLLQQKHQRVSTSRKNIHI